jgi:hypothetical protein
MTAPVSKVAGLLPPWAVSPPHAKVHLGDGQLDEVRQLYGDRRPINVEHVDLGILLQIVTGVAYLGAVVQYERRSFGIDVLACPAVGAACA